MRLVRCITALLAVCALGACQSLVPNQGFDPQMTAQQIKAIASDKSAGVVCSTVPTPWGVAKITTVNIDQRVIDTGGVSVDPDCRVSILTQKTPPPVKETKETAKEPKT